MAHALSIIEENGSTLSLTATNWMLRNYTPTEADTIAFGEAANSANADLIGDVLYAHVTETVELYAYATTKPLLQDAINDLQALIRKAQQRQRRGVGNRIFLSLQVDGEASAWQSEILSGRVELATDSLALWANIGTDVRLFLTRRSYFEASALSSVRMTSSATAETTFGVVVSNTVDTNWAGIGATRITGTLPAPLKIEVTHMGTSGSYRKLQMVNNASVSPTTYDAYRTGAESTVASGAISQTNPTGDVVLLRWALPTAMLDLLQGAHVRALAVLSSLSSGAQLRGFVETTVGGSYHVRHRGALVDGDSMLVDLGQFPVPPGASSTGYGNITFGIGVRYDGSFSGTVAFIQLVPADGERRMTLGDDVVLVADDNMTDDPYTGSMWAYDDASGKKFSLGAAQGGPLWAYPGVVQRLYVVTASLGGYVSSRQHIIKAWYKPRRLTI